MAGKEGRRGLIGLMETSIIHACMQIAAVRPSLLWEKGSVILNRTRLRREERGPLVGRLWERGLGWELGMVCGGRCGMVFSLHSIFHSGGGVL